MKQYSVILFCCWYLPVMSQSVSAKENPRPETAVQTHQDQLREDSFKKDLLKRASVIKKDRTYKSGDRRTEVLTYLVLKEPVQLNCLVLKEDAQFGPPSIESMDIVLSDHGSEVKKMTITAVGNKRILTFPALEVSELSFIITAAKAKPHLGAISGYLIDEKLVEKE